MTQDTQEIQHRRRHCPDNGRESARKRACTNVPTAKLSTLSIYRRETHSKPSRVGMAKEVHLDLMSP